MMRTGLVVIVASLIVGSASLRAATSEQLHAAFESMSEAKIQSQRTLDVQNVTIAHQDVTFELIAGQLVFFEPVVIDADSFYYAAFFRGEGHIRFAPPVDVERDQLRRWYKSDSLDRPFEDMLLMFSPAIYEQLLRDCPVSSTPIDSRAEHQARKLRKELIKDETHFHMFCALTAQLRKFDRPFLFADLKPHKSPRVHYWFDPDWREEVVLTRHDRKPGVSYQESICKYTQYVEQDYPNLNGRSKERLLVSHVRTDGTIDRSGRYTGSAELSIEVLKQVRAVRLFLHEELTVDSVLDAEGRSLSFSRWESWDHKSLPLYLFLNEPLQPGQNTKLTFFYNGKIAERVVGEFVVSAGSRWYPRIPDGTNNFSTFDLNFRTPRDFAFLVSGNKVASDTLKDTVISRWTVNEPCRNVTFSIGNMTRFQFGDTETGPVDIFYHKDLHGYRNRQKQVAEDIVGSIKLFSRLFGEYAYPRTSVSEIIALHSEAFPGFVHLGYSAWETDDWGTERLTRAHEVAHQWWGVGVNYETYHDQWLSEGFSDYSALLYYQAAYGNKKFAKKLRDYRDRIFSVRKYLFGSGAESGPIILGARTASSKTPGDYGLIVYQKGAFVLHMLRNMLMDVETMNEDVFFKMMRHWYLKYLGKFATTADFQAHVEQYVGMDMTWFFQQWVYGNDLPTYKFKYDLVRQADGTFTANCKVTTKDVADDFKMYLPIEIVFDDDRRVYARILIDQPEMQFPIEGIVERPDKLRLNPFESVLCKVKQ
jgi:hypothetical protein